MLKELKKNAIMILKTVTFPCKTISTYWYTRSYPFCISRTFPSKVPKVVFIKRKTTISKLHCGSNFVNIRMEQFVKVWSKIGYLY